MLLPERIRALLGQLSEGIYEKDEALRLGLLAAVAGESLFLLGPPGVAKSLIARKLKFAFRDGKSFEYLMNKFSTPDELFGPVSIKKLKEEDRYERLTDRYLPGANVVFLDEIWKAGSSIQNALLTILNEKVYRNGEQEMEVDIRLILAASNELPPAGEGLDALWDRFLLRCIVTEIRNRNSFLQMIANTQDVYQDTAEAALKISRDELRDWQAHITAVSLPAEVLNVIQLVKLRLEEHDGRSGSEPFEVYDRRWKKAVHLLRTSAFLHGRAQVDLMDCFLLVHCLWRQPSQIETLQSLLAEIIRRHGYTIALQLGHLKKEISELEEEVRHETQIPYATTAEEPYLVDKKFYEVLNISKYFDGKYIRQSEAERLTLDQLDTISLYDEAQKLTYKIQAKRGLKPNQIEIYHNAQTNVFELKTVKTEQVKHIAKKPHPMLLRYWDERTEQLLRYIKTALQETDVRKPAELQGIRQHLFVPAARAEIVEANLHDAINTLNALLLRVEKVRFYYQHLDADSPLPTPALSDAPAS